MNLVINSQIENMLDGACAVEDHPFLPEPTYGIESNSVLNTYPSAAVNGDIGTIEPSVDFGRPLQDWFEMALKVETPVKGPVRASWGEDEDETEEEPVKEDAEDEETDPFEDFDEDDFDDDFDDDFEEELDDEYEIEPADDGLVTDPDADLGNAEILDEEEEVVPDADEID